LRGSQNKILKLLLLAGTIVLLSFLDLCAQYVQEDSIVFSIDIEDVVITGQGLPTDSKNATYKVKSITQEQIIARGHTQLHEALASLPNVRITNDPILGTSLKLRGISSDNVAILVDGVPIIGRLNGGVDLSQINLSDIKKIEVIEGPLSMLYGNNAAGGVVNIITHKSIAGKKKLRLDAQYELPGIHNYAVTGAMQMHGFFISASGQYSKHQLYPLDSTRIFQSFTDDEGNTVQEEKYPWNPKEQWAGNLTTRYNLNDQAYFIYKYSYLTEEVTDLGKLIRPQFLPYAWDRRYETDRNDHSLFYHQEWDKYLVDLTLANNDFKRLFTTERFNFEPNEIDPTLTQVDTNYVNLFFAKANVSSRLNKQINFLAGVNYNRETATGDRVLDPENPESAGVTVDDISLFANVDYEPIDDLKLSGSGRYLYSDVYGTNFTPAIQAKWNSDKFWTWRVSYANGFRLPTLKERFINFIDINHFIVSNPDLLPESSRDFSLSSSYERPDGDRLLKLDLSGYHTSISDKIILAAFEPGKFNYRNLNSFSSTGVNLGWQYITKSWKLRGGAGAGYWTSNEISGAERKPVLDIQQSIDYLLPHNINTSLNWRYVGSEPRFAEINGNIVESTITGYSLLDLHFNKADVMDRLHIGAGIKNILNVSSTDIIGGSGGGGVNPHETGASSQLVNQGRTVYFKLIADIF
jgi:outer membrane receptor for ferrienterochelin and colicins